jgi:hypothetical protein
METAQTFINGPGLLPQLVLAVLTLTVIYTVITLYEKLMQAIKKFMNQTVTLIKDTITSGQVIPQYPGSGYPLIYQSENEIHGLEQSFSMWIFIHPETFDDIAGQDQCGGQTSNAKVNRLKHIFHKGNKDAFPLLAPGIFCQSNKNTIRIYTNAVNKWDNYCEVPNIPVAKWFHMVVSQKGQFMDVFINGNVIARHKFDTVPKINYGGVYVMQNIRTPKDVTKPIESDDGPYIVDGPIKGMMSRIKYFAYALNYSNIDALYHESPSKIITTSQAIEAAKGQRPPYFYDNWWVTQY